MSEWLSPPIGGVVHADTNPSMRTEVRDLWVAALRSGIYPQSHAGRLRTEEGFCPLGVLCDVAATVGVLAWENIDSSWFIGPWIDGTTVPPLIYDWAGFAGMHPSQLVPLEYGGVVHPVYRLNDRFKLDFDKIAELVETQY